MLSALAVCVCADVGTIEVMRKQRGKTSTECVLAQDINTHTHKGGEEGYLLRIDSTDVADDVFAGGGGVGGEMHQDRRMREKTIDATERKDYDDDDDDD